MIWFVLEAEAEAERENKGKTACLQEIQYVCWCMSAVLQEVLMWTRRSNIELVVILNPHPVPLIGSGWKTLMQTHTLTEYLGGFLLNDQRSNIIPSFLVVFGVCAVTVWKLSREQTNTYNSLPHMMIIQSVRWRIGTLPAVLMFIPTLCIGTSAGSSSRSLWCFRMWQI